CPARRHPRVRGLLPRALGRDQPRRRRGHAQARPRRRGVDHPAMIGTPRVHHRVTDSTNERAKQLALAGAPHGTLVTAEEQTAGRGRQGRQWVAPPGKALLMSVVLRDLGAAQAHLPLAAALAACEASELSVPHIHCTIKWPNDVWLDGRKLA